MTSALVRPREREICEAQQLTPRSCSCRHLEGEVEPDAQRVDDPHLAAESLGRSVAFRLRSLHVGRAGVSGASGVKAPLSPGLRVDGRALSLPTEPNNRSPLNVEAADLWDDQVAVRAPCNSRDASSPPFRMQFKRELLKHYRPIEDE